MLHEKHLFPLVHQDKGRVEHQASSTQLHSQSWRVASEDEGQKGWESVPRLPRKSIMFA